jgi:hypothetical protein
MKLKIILLLSTFLYGCAGMAQVVDDNKKSEFYQYLILELGVDKDIPIFYKTSLTPFKRVDLKNDKLLWYIKGEVQGMKAFINGLDIHRLIENELLPK